MPVDEGERLALGFDVGSVALKVAVTDLAGNLIEKSYTRTHGQPLETAFKVLAELLDHHPAEAFDLVAGTGTTGRLICQLLGVTPEDITEYDLPTHPLKEVDIKRARDAMANDPFIRHYKIWQKAIEKMLKMGVRVEQQALAKHGLDYVAKTYLPKKLKKISAFLP